jgi:hypothetical protein
MSCPEGAIIWHLFIDNFVSFAGRAFAGRAHNRVLPLQCSPNDNDFWVILIRVLV